MTLRLGFFRFALLTTATFCLLAHPLSLQSANATAEGGKCYVKKESWSDTLLASRQAYGQYWKTLYQKARPGPWYATNDKNFLPSDSSIDLMKKDATGKHFWTRRMDLFDGDVHYDLGADAAQTRLLVREIETHNPVTLTVWIGAREGLELWLNGKRVFQNKNLGKGLVPTPDQASVKLELRAGVNQLALKTVGRGWGGFYFAPTTRERMNPLVFRTIMGSLQEDFPATTKQMRRDALEEEILEWFRAPGETELVLSLIERAIREHETVVKQVYSALRNARRNSLSQGEKHGLELYDRVSVLRRAWDDLADVDFEALRLAVLDLTKTFPTAYTRGPEYLRRLDAYEKRASAIRELMKQSDTQAISEVAEIVAFKREVLLANPLLDFEKMLVVRRKVFGNPRVAQSHRGLGAYLGMPQQSSFQLHRIREYHGWENEIAYLSMRNPEGPLEPIYRPEKPRLVSGIELNFDADKMMFAMPGHDDRYWQVYEMNLSGGAPKEITPSGYDDVHNFDPIYLPDGRIIFVSTAPFQGVPCNPSIKVAMSYIMDPDGTNIRQLTFDQDHNYYPAVMNDGRILYLRWEYTDIPHVWGRYLFTMNPDGSGQRAYYGSGSYWPNSMFFARPIPGHPTKVVTIVTGHHEGRDGELYIIDPAVGRSKTGGIIQQIPGRGKEIVPRIKDKLTENIFPRFLHPYPLNENYFLVSCKPTADDLWGIYLVDTFDNMLLLREIEEEGLFEPIPVLVKEKPPLIADRIDLTRDDALVFLEDVYQGPGLAGVPRGSIAELRLYTYHFAYDKIVGISNRVGTNGPWEPKRILGTVPIEDDGSAYFRVPANTPISIQAIDHEGKALQLMRSWTTAMPGEFVSCTGCHENQNGSPANAKTIAMNRTPSEIKLWRGPVRGISFKAEVQPVLDKYCVGCHDGEERKVKRGIPDLRADQGSYVGFKRGTPKVETIKGLSKEQMLKKYAGVFEPSFITLRSFVRVGGLESDLRLLPPGEFHADTSELVQMLQKGHHGVQLDDEAWDRLITWIDLNAPCHGTWGETAGFDKIKRDYQRRREMRSLYADLHDNPEEIVAPEPAKIEFVKPKRAPKAKIVPVTLADWPLDAAEAARRQAEAAPATERTLSLGDGVEIKLVLIPAGSFVMGDAKGYGDETPLARVQIDKPYWMGKFEITNKQYNVFDPDHDSRYEHAGSMIFSEYNRGPLMNHPDQPVVRVSWCEARDFCYWLSEKTGETIALPNEAQWEYACRAGSATPFSYGDVDTDFSKFANMADISIKKLAYWGGHDVPDLIPRDPRFDDGYLVNANVGTFAANPWGLHDMHGNAMEWTRTAYRPYPYADDGRNAPAAEGEKTVRGGSWNDRPKRCRSAFRLSYPEWQKVYNVGFRVIIETTPAPKVAQAQPAP